MGTFRSIPQIEKQTRHQIKTVLGNSMWWNDLQHEWIWIINYLLWWISIASILFDIDLCWDWYWSLTIDMSRDRYNSTRFYKVHITANNANAFDALKMMPCCVGRIGHGKGSCYNLIWSSKIENSTVLIPVGIVPWSQTPRPVICSSMQSHSSPSRSSHPSWCPVKISPGNLC